jgi:translation initiation factor IF-2
MVNKIDNISGWKKGKNVFENVDIQGLNVKNDFEGKFYTLVGALNSRGFDIDLYWNIKDFTKKIAGSRL